MNFIYNFRLAPEAIWLIVNTVLGALLVEAISFVGGFSSFPGVNEWQTWAGTLAVSLIRTALGALLAVVSGGGFQAPGTPGPAPEG